MVIIALAGAAILGFIWAWYQQANNMGKVSQEIDDLKKQLAGQTSSHESLKQEIKTQKLTIENLQKQVQTAETELIESQTMLRVMEGEIKVMEREKRILTNENEQLEEELRNNIREIEVIREVSGHSSPDPNDQMKNQHTNERIENAKRLVFAFKKGVSENQNTPTEEG